MPHRVRRQAHSLKRDIGQASQQRQANSPMSMTSPMTTLTLGQHAPLLFRSSVAPHSTLPHSESGVFLRRDLRHRADYYANPSPATCLDHLLSKFLAVDRSLYSLLHYDTSDSNLTKRCVHFLAYPSLSITEENWSNEQAELKKQLGEIVDLSSRVCDQQNTDE